MAIEKHDVIIVGAGTAGMSTAYGLRNSNLCTLMLEKREEPFNTNPAMYTRVTFMDYLHDSRFQEANPEESILLKYSAAEFDTHNAMISKQYPEKLFCAFNTDKFRENLEKKLTDNIKLKRGVFIRDAKRIKGGIAVFDTNGKEYFGNIVVDCSGTSAVILGSLGYRKSPAYFMVASFELENCRIPAPETVRIFMDKSITDNGGGWLYPLSEDKCHFGASIIIPYSKYSKDDLWARTYNLMKWDKYGKWLKKARIVEATRDIKASPTLEPVPVMVGDNFIASGDVIGAAASYIGEGERPAGLLGLANAEVIKEAYADKDFSQQKLEAVVKEYQKLFGCYDLWSYAARVGLSKLDSNEDWARMFKRINNTFSPEKFLKVLRSEYTRGIAFDMFDIHVFKDVIVGVAKEKFNSIYSVIKKIADAAEFR